MQSATGSVRFISTALQDSRETNDALRSFEKDDSDEEWYTSVQTQELGDEQGYGGGLLVTLTASWYASRTRHVAMTDEQLDEAFDRIVDRFCSFVHDVLNTGIELEVACGAHRRPMLSEALVSKTE